MLKSRTANYLVTLLLIPSKSQREGPCPTGLASLLYLATTLTYRRIINNNTPDTNRPPAISVTTTIQRKYELFTCRMIDVPSMSSSGPEPENATPLRPEQGQEEAGGEDKKDSNDFSSRAVPPAASHASLLTSAFAEAGSRPSTAPGPDVGSDAPRSDTERL